MKIESADNKYFFDRKIRKIESNMEGAHFHEENELYYLEKGKAKYFIGSDIFLLESGDMVFIPAGVFHKTEYIAQSTLDRVLFSFKDSFVGDEGAEYLEEIRKNKFIRVPKDNLFEVKSIISKIERENIRKEKGYEKVQKLAFVEMLILISRYSSKKGKTPLDNDYLFVQTIAKYISENYNSDLSLEFLSKKYALTPCHLSRTFKKKTGVSLSEYINIARITEAEKLLSNSNMTITEIATRTGFNDSNYFASVFKKLRGITPKKYSIMKKGKSL